MFDPELHLIQSRTSNLEFCKNNIINWIFIENESSKVGNEYGSSRINPLRSGMSFRRSETNSKFENKFKIYGGSDKKYLFLSKLCQKGIFWVPIILTLCEKTNLFVDKKNIACQKSISWHILEEQMTINQRLGIYFRYWRIYFLRSGINSR